MSIIKRAFAITPLALALLGLAYSNLALMAIAFTACNVVWYWLYSNKICQICVMRETLEIMERAAETFRRRPPSEL